MKSPVFVCYLLLCCAAALGADRPNLVIINVDDLGYGDIEPFGSPTKTPNLVRMAQEGRKLLSHYAAVVCSPSRAALMTGCYPKRVLQIPHVLFPVASVGLNPQEQNIAKVLHGAGYSTACFGKWHLGDQPEFLPLQQGFDVYLGVPYSNDMGPTEDGTKSSIGAPIPVRKPGAKAPPVTQDETGVRGLQPPLAILEGNKVVGRVRQAEQETLTKRWTEGATKFIRDQAGKGPFFVYLAESAVHFPFYPREEFRSSQPPHLPGAVREIDWSVGQILEALQLAKVAENTLVIFTSDNGGSLPHGSSNGPLRGSKGETWEGGIRTPTMAWWPGKVPAGTSTWAITSMMDLLPTFGSLAGAKLDPARKIDGLNILPVLTGAEGTVTRDKFFYFRGAVLEAVRQGDWKLHLAKGELYNLAQDLGEKQNVASGQVEKVAELRALAATMQGDLGTEGFGPGCRAMGHVKEAKPLLAD